jgi:hypothetical protein
MRNHVLIAMFALVFASSVGLAQQRSSHPPSDEAIDFAQRTSDLLLNTLFAALTQEFDETTPVNVEEGKQSISLVFSDSHSNFRLVGTLDPLRANDVPQDNFESRALGLALDGGQGLTEVQRNNGAWFYRRSIPLSAFRAECALCHSNFVGLDASDWVGALMLKVPIEQN